MAAPVFGIHAVDALLRRNPRSVSRLLLQAGRADRRMAALAELAANQGVTVERLPQAALSELVAGRHQGAVAELNDTAAAVGDGSNSWSEADLLRHVDHAQRPVLLLILDGVTDPHNLGACLRSAEAAGADAVVFPRDRSASINPTVRKVACGAAEIVATVQVSNLARTLEALKTRGVWLYGAAGEAEQSLYEQDLTGPIALVMGGEGDGLRRLTRECCDRLVRLPMAGSVSSLNVSVAAGVCLFEAVRQRGASGP